MSGHYPVRHFEHDVFAACPPLIPFLKVKAPGICNEVSLPDSPGMGNPFATKILVLSIKSVGKVVRGIKNEFRMVEEAENNRHVVYREKSGRFVSLSVEVLMPDVKRDR